MNSVYNIELHVSVPTLDYIKQSTGIDVVLEEGNKERAEGKIRSLTARARDFLFYGKPSETQRIISYLIFKGTWKQAWEQYAVRYIEATFYHGDESAWTNIPRPILNAIHGSVLQAERFTANIIQEVKFTTEVF